jgi:hypothetical protein
MSIRDSSPWKSSLAWNFDFDRFCNGLDDQSGNSYHGTHSFVSFNKTTYCYFQATQSQTSLPVYGQVDRVGSYVFTGADVSYIAVGNCLV